MRVYGIAVRGTHREYCSKPLKRRLRAVPLQSVDSKLGRTCFLLSLASLDFLVRVTILRDCSQSNLNVALLNVFQYLNVRYRHIFIPYKFFICSDFLAERLVIRLIQAYFYSLKFFIHSDFLAESVVIRKLQGSKLTFSKISGRKKGSRKFQATILG